ncbi:MAG: ATP-binding cassette domain-containing protein [Cloacibacterium normanense]
MNANGAGKTTTFYMIVGLVKPTSGKITLDGKDITNDAMYKRAQKRNWLFGSRSFCFQKIVGKKIIFWAFYNSLINQRRTNPQNQRTHRRIFIKEHVRKNRGDLLSGGERRRTEIARCLATDPDFILLDEPFAGVDPIAVEDIQKIIRSLVKKDIGVLITDHNVQQTLAITNKTYIMFEGNILKEGIPEDLANDPDVRRAYLGENFRFEKF